jgi:2-polyprenyl-3-methyl-5-hydroxy-6-metoxy-1,4-benzoquinol methylase
MRRFNMHWWAVRYYALLCRRVLRAGRGRRFLDVGCAHGYALARLEGEFETWGVDVSEYAIGRARDIAPRSRTLVHDITVGVPDALRDVRFDLVLMKYVLEHLPEPGAVLARVADLLAPGGALLFSVPNTESPGRRLKGERWFGCLDRTHCSLLDPPTWRRLTAHAGLAIEREWSDGLWDVPYVRGVPAMLQLPIFAAPTIAEVLVGGTFLPVGWGENLLVLARRRP